jgi:hypothetical protein
LQPGIRHADAAGDGFGHVPGDICRGSARLLPWRMACRRGTPRASRFRIRVRTSRHRFQKHIRKLQLGREREVARPASQVTRRVPLLACAAALPHAPRQLPRRSARAIFREQLGGPPSGTRSPRICLEEGVISVPAQELLGHSDVRATIDLHARAESGRPRPGQSCGF